MANLAFHQIKKVEKKSITGEMLLCLLTDFVQLFLDGSTHPRGFARPSVGPSRPSQFYCNKISDFKFKIPDFNLLDLDLHNYDPFLGVNANITD